MSWETAALEGLTDFVLERAKSELRQWVVSGMLDDVCPAPPEPSIVPKLITNLVPKVISDRFPDPASAKDYLPETCSVARQFAYGLPVADSLFVRSLRNDLKSLPAYLVWVSAQERLQSRPPPSVVEKGEWGYVLTSYFEGLQRGERPILLAAGLADTSAIKADAGSDCALKDNGTISTGNCALYWAGLFARAYVMAADAGPNDAQATGTRLLIGIYTILNESDTEAARVTSALLSGKLEAVFRDPAKLRQQVTDLSARFSSIRSLINEVEAESNRLRKLQDDSKTTGKQVLAIAARITELAARMVKETAGLAESARIFQVSDDVQARLSRAETILRAAGSIAAGQYTDALNQLSFVITCVARDSQMRLEKECADWPAAKNLPKEAKLFVRHLPLIVGMADAKSADDFEKVLNNAASPVGAWRFKRERDMWSVTSFVGFQGGYERLSGAGISDYGGYIAGMFVPVGIDFSFPTSGNRNAWGLLLSVIDLGNLVSARVSGKDSAQVADTSTDVKFKNVISPGLYWHHGFRNSPMVWGGGFGYTSGLRQAQVPGGGQTNVTSSRFSLFLAIDVTIFAF